MRRRYAGRYRRARPTRRVRKSRLLGKRRRVSKNVKRYVKRAIHRTVETKEKIDYGANQPIVTASASAPVGQILIPTMTNGTSAGQMIGNQIKCVRGYIKGHVNLLPYNITTNPNPPPLYVKMWLVKNLVTQGSAASFSWFDWTKFFKLSGGMTGFQGNMLDVEFPVNTEYWRVLAKKTIKLGVGGATATGPISSGSYLDNSSFSRPFFFNYGRYLKKTLKFLDGGGACQNAGIYLLIQAVNANGDASAYNPCEYHFVNHFKYEDA